MKDTTYLHGILEQRGSALAPRVERFIREKIDFLESYDFGQHSIEDVRKAAGNGPARRMREYFDSDDDFIEWFYSPALALDGKAPSEYMTMDRSAVRKLLGIIESGEYALL